MYIWGNEGETVIISVYVHDLIVTGVSAEEIKVFKEQMMREFEMSDLGLLLYYLGIEVEQKTRCITIKQSS